jgi:hypothetical protein
MARITVPEVDTETLHVDDTSRRVRETAVLQVAKSVIDQMEWHDGVDDTPWRNPCQIAREGSVIYYRYPTKSE